MRGRDLRDRPGAHGVFNFDLKENEAGIPCITEINAGRFAMITNIYDLIGRHNMAASYAQARLRRGRAHRRSLR